MSIIWQYLDKRSATVNALKDFKSMKFIVENTDDEIRNLRADIDGVRSPQMDGMPHSHNTGAAEDRIIRVIEEVDVLKERYRQAVEYMDWFVPAWEQLSEDERFLLETFYEERDYGYDAIYLICQHFSVERTAAYNKKNRALNHLVTLLFGKA